MVVSLLIVRVMVLLVFRTFSFCPFFPPIDTDRYSVDPLTCHSDTSVEPDLFVTVILVPAGTIPDVALVCPPPLKVQFMQLTL